MTGKLIVFSAPSGAGKTTLVRKLIDKGLGLEFSVSACTRKKRDNETDGIDYHFITVDDFKEKIDKNEFLEWQEVYPGSYYGTLKSEVEKVWQRGKHVIFDVDVKGGLNIKKAYPEKTLAIFVKPPDIEKLKQRLLQRNTETNESFAKRIEKANYEMTFEKDFDIVIINDILEKAEEEAIKAVFTFINIK